MYTSKLRTVGGSVMFAIPKPVLEGLGLGPDQQVDLSIDGERLIIQARKKPHYTLDALLAAYETKLTVSDEERAWMDMPDIGDEVVD